MVSNFLWVLIISFVLLIIVYIFNTNSNHLMYRSTSGRNTLRTYTGMNSPASHISNTSSSDFLKKIGGNIRDTRKYYDSAKSPSSTISSISIDDFKIGDFEMFQDINQSQRYTFQVGKRKFRSIGEELVCKIFEEHLGYEVLVNKRPDFLKNPKTGRNLELDVWDPKTKTAIEYNGFQHYRDPENPTEISQELIDQEYRDELKKKLCKENGIYLIIVPYTIDSIQKNSKGIVKSVVRSKSVREEKLRTYLMPYLKKIN